MTLPIPMTRPAPEPASAPGYEPASSPPAHGREFGTALANAMHESPARPSESARPRRARSARDTDEARATASEDAGARASARSGRRTRTVAERHDAAEDNAPRGNAGESARAERPVATTHARSDDADDAPGASHASTEAAPAPSPVATDASGVTETIDAARIPTTDAADPYALVGDPRLAFRDVLATWAEGGQPHPSGATRDAVAGTGPTADPASDADVTIDDSALEESARALAERFVASSLEAAVAPLAPLALVATTPASGPVATGDTPAASTDVPAGSAAPLALSPRDKRLDSEARLAGIAAAMARNPLGVRKETEALVPEMRQRLDRVIERMEGEYGYTVSVVETVRSQERQDALFAQGRTAPGPVVTWTRNSRHTDGLAADLVIDGGYTNAAGFERLARVAREEGLRTLWPRDPGHIELAQGSASLAGAQGMRAAVLPDGATADVLPFPASATAAAPAATPAIPRAARAAIDPAALRRERPPALGPLGGSTIPAPAGETQLLPFPAAGVPRLGDEGEGHPVVMTAGEAMGTIDRELLAAAARQNAAKGSALPNAPQQVSGVARVATVATVAAVAPVAQVAHVATVAEVATVAQVARVATVGGTAGSVSGDAGVDGTAPSAPTVIAGPTIARDGGANGQAAGDRRSSGDRGDRRDRAARSDNERDAVAGVTMARDDREGTRVPLTRDPANRELALGDTGGRDAASGVAGLTRSDATERIARVLRIQEAGNDRPLSSVLLRLDTPDGGEDRIRIDMRGRTIGATLDVADPQAAEQLRQHVGELQQALQRQGLEGESMIVRTAQRTTDATTLTASAVAAERDVLRAASASASDGGGSTAKDSRTPTRSPFEREFGREGTDQQRSRQRRDGKGETR